MYLKFLDFKEQVMSKLNVAMKYEQVEKDNFMYHKPQDMYFGNDDGPSWNTQGFSPQLATA